MQTDHYMANMGKLGRAERLIPMGLERVDDLAGLEQRQVVADLDLATGRSAEADGAQSGLCRVRRTLDGEAQLA